MPTKVRITGVIAPTGKNLMAAVYNPDLTTLGYMSLQESPAGSGQYGGQQNFTMPDALADPYEVEVRECVTPDSSGFNSSTTIRSTRGTLGWVKTNVLLRTDPYLDTAVSGITSGGGGSFNLGNTTITSDTNGPGTTSAGYLSIKDENNVGVGGALVHAYLSTAYAANPNTAATKGFAISQSDGSWTGMRIDTGFTYIFIARGPDGRTYGPMSLLV